MGVLKYSSSGGGGAQKGRISALFSIFTFSSQRAAKCFRHKLLRSCFLIPSLILKLKYSSGAGAAQKDRISASLSFIFTFFIQ